MRWIPFLLLCLFFLVLPASPQLGAPLGRCGPHPPDPDWPKNQFPSTQATAANSQKSVAETAQLARDAHDLAELSASIPADLDHLNRGLLPKDLIEKLKRVEKLSKRLRNELTQ